jgi:hypothetical protein
MVVGNDTIKQRAETPSSVLASLEALDFQTAVEYSSADLTGLKYYVCWYSKDEKECITLRTAPSNLICRLRKLSLESWNTPKSLIEPVRVRQNWYNLYS